MAKKKQEKVEVEKPQITANNEMKQVVIEKEKPKKDSWEIKDRVYYLKNNLTPLSYSIKAANIYWFDEEKGYERELKSTSNQRTVFVDEMVGDQRLEHIIFRDGSLFVPKNKVVLQKLLSLYHPHRDKLFEEYKPVQEAAEDIDYLEMEIEALTTAKNLDIDMAEAIMRVELGSKVSELSSKELKRDLLLYARRNPSLFLELVNDDNVQLRNFGIKATEANIIKLAQDQRSFVWGSNGRKLMTIPFEENPYSALAAWFKTDEGTEVYKAIEKKLK